MTDRNEPALASLPAADIDVERGKAMRRAQTSARLPWLAIAIVAAIVAVAVVVWRMQSQPIPEPAAVAVPAPPATPAPAAEAPPPIRHPIEEANVSDVTAPPAVAQPLTAESLVAGLFALPGAAGLDHLIVTDDFVHRFVATVDNLPRASVASKVMVVRPAEGTFAVDVEDGRTVLGSANATRHAPYVSVLQALDTRSLVALYARNYALFQQAYRELGYPNGYFNDRLVDAIDDLLATPDPATPPVLQQPRVLYEYVNPNLEGSSAGQKAMLRLGAENARAAKVKLREIRAALTSSQGGSATK